MNKSDKTKYVIVGLVLVMFSIVSTGCGKPRGEGTTLASVGSTKITVGSFNERISNLPKRYQSVVKRQKKDFLERLINDILLYQKAIKKGLQKDRDVLKVIEEAKKKILIARLLKEDVNDKIDISEEDIVLYYNENKSDYMTPEIMRVSHILVQSLEAAEEIVNKLEAGEDFDKLAKAKSVDPTAQRGGDIGYFPRGQLMPEFENACTKLKIGETSGVVKTKLGYHVIKLTDRRPPEQKPLERVKENIKSKLRATERQKIFNSLLKQLREETEIKIDEEVLSELEQQQEEKESAK